MALNDEGWLLLLLRAAISVIVSTSNYEKVTPCCRECLRLNSVESIRHAGMM